MGGVDRLTDTSKYTGTHKERFDASGKGKGKTGREDVSENTGYVGGYKGKDTYNETHKWDRFNIKILWNFPYTVDCWNKMNIFGCWTCSNIALDTFYIG